MNRHSQGVSMNWVWVLIPLTALSIPIIAIISGVIEKYIKSQERQANLMSEEMMSEIMALRDASEQQRQIYEQRIANLEAIVTTQAWQNKASQALPSSDQRYPMPDLEELKNLSNEKKVAILAEKLK